MKNQVLLILSFIVLSNGFIGRLSRRFPGLFLSSETIANPTSVMESSGQKALTQKEYLLAIRNRIFAVEEQLWLHEYALAHPGGKISPLSNEKYNAFLLKRSELLEEFPATKLYTDLYETQNRNLTYASIFIERLIENFNRQIPVPLDHINQIAVLSSSGQVVNLLRGQGALNHRLLPSNVLADRGVKRQFQHPAFSNKGQYLAMVEMHFRDGASIERADALVFEVPKDPGTFADSDSLPTFDSGALNGTPFFIRFSPNDDTLAMLCTPPTSEPGDPYTALVLLEWQKYYKKDQLAGQAASARFAPRKSTTVLQGNPLFFTYTTSSADNATIVAHCQKEVSDPVTKTSTTEKAVWLLQKQDTGGVMDYNWMKICDSQPAQKWSTPVCHSAGGGDSVLVVEDGYLVSKSISRWKRDSEGKLLSKKLMRVQGQVQFLVAPDNSRAVVLQEDITMGHYSLTVIEGEDALDPSRTTLGNQYEMPNDKLAVAFWFSPDSTKVLCLTAAGKSKQDVASQKGLFRVGLNSEMQWAVFNFPLQELREYEVFKPTPYFMKTYVPFFSMYAQSYNPWAPDSRSFIHVTPVGLSHTPLVGKATQRCLGEEPWQNQGATFGTWSRF